MENCKIANTWLSHNFIRFDGWGALNRCVCFWRTESTFLFIRPLLQKKWWWIFAVMFLLENRNSRKSKTVINFISKHVFSTSCAGLRYASFQSLKCLTAKSLFVNRTILLLLFIKKPWTEHWVDCQKGFCSLYEFCPMVPYWYKS